MSYVAEPQQSLAVNWKQSAESDSYSGFRLAYLVNQYPYPSGTFIRREVAAMERLGFEVFRYSLRQTNARLLDPQDLIEASKTRIVMNLGLAGLLGPVIRTALTHPVRFLRALILCIRVGWRSDRGLIHNLAYLLEACQLTRWLVADRIEHLHAHYGTNSATVAMLSHVLGGPSYSFTSHGPDEFDKPHFLRLGEKVSRSKFAVAISEYGRSQLYRWTPYKHWSKVNVVHCGLDRDFLESEETPPPASRRLLFIGRLAEQKGVLLLVEAANLLKDQGIEFELVIVGDGPQKQDLKDRIAHYGLEDNVILAGWKTDRQVREELIRSRALVMASFAEGLPVVIMEALALGRPVISTNIAGVAELVIPEVCGWLVPAGAVEPLAEKMREVLELSTEELAEMGRHGSQRVSMRHNIDTEAAKLAKLIASATTD